MQTKRLIFDNGKKNDKIIEPKTVTKLEIDNKNLKAKAF